MKASTLFAMAQHRSSNILRISSMQGIVRVHIGAQPHNFNYMSILMCKRLASAIWSHISVVCFSIDAEPLQKEYLHESEKCCNQIKYTNIKKRYAYLTLSLMEKGEGIFQKEHKIYDAQDNENRFRL